MTRRLTFAAAALAAAIAVPAAWAGDAPACTLRIVTSLDLDMAADGRLRVPVTLNHQPFRMLVDTGAFVSIVSTRTTKVLDVQPRPILDGAMAVGGDGRKMHNFVNLKHFALGRLQSGSTQFVVDPRSLPDYDGLFGEDYLANYDLDFDLAKGKLNLIRAEGCTDGVVYWTKGKYGAIPFVLDELAIKLTVTLDGKQVKAKLDTGSGDTAMNLEAAAYDFGIDSNKFPTGIGANTFKTMSIGDVNVSHPVVELLSAKVFPALNGSNQRMLVGMNVLRNLHVYISYKQRMIYVTPATQY